MRGRILRKDLQLTKLLSFFLLFFFFFDHVLVFKASGTSLLWTRNIPTLDGLHSSVIDGLALAMVYRTTGHYLYSYQRAVGTVVRPVRHARWS
jgi:hypothetical protein